MQVMGDADATFNQYGTAAAQFQTYTNSIGSGIVFALCSHKAAMMRLHEIVVGSPLQYSADSVFTNIDRLQSAATLNVANPEVVRFSYQVASNEINAVFADRASGTVSATFLSLSLILELYRQQALSELIAIQSHLR